MKYSTGQHVKVGDKVRLWQGCHGVVVLSVDDNEYSPEYPKEQWAYLQTGVLLKTDFDGLIHYKEADEDLELID